MNIGRHTYVTNPIDVKNWNEGTSLTIGSFCSISDNCTIFLGGNHRTEWITTFPFHNWYIDGYDYNTSHYSDGNVIIGNDVWIGHNVTILSGITIGDGAVIGANSTVTKNVEPYSIVAGNPAKFIKKRFTDEQIETLLKISWWNLSDDQIKPLLPYLLSSNIENFIQYVASS
jgi:acetyltransferase-like isoleucine patch superfamily enzyme